MVRHLLYELGYSLQANRKTTEGSAHPDRDAQFRHINAAVARHMRRGRPAILVDTKKKPYNEERACILHVATTTPRCRPRSQEGIS